ncbi:recombinase family protein [Iodidimonas nitroreducens]|uniref:recombinase family protein n=1 Tax=Iodidimonas nitroreducens TaxID=1236968 RepID=UPI0036F1C412
MRDSMKTMKGNNKAVIYCRVSDTKQTTRGTGLQSQETRCREYASFRGHEVVQVFTDDASGGLINRPGMQAMLSFLRKQRRKPHVVIIDDISRLARGVQAHLELRLPSARQADYWNLHRLSLVKTATASLSKTFLPASPSTNDRRTASKRSTVCARGRSMGTGSSRPRLATAMSVSPDKGKSYTLTNRQLQFLPKPLKVTPASALRHRLRSSVSLNRIPSFRRTPTEKLPISGSTIF